MTARADFLAEYRCARLVRQFEVDCLSGYPCSLSWSLSRPARAASFRFGDRLASPTPARRAHGIAGCVGRAAIIGPAARLPA